MWSDGNSNQRSKNNLPLIIPKAWAWFLCWLLLWKVLINTSKATSGLSILACLAVGEHRFLEESAYDEVISTHWGFQVSSCMNALATVAIGRFHRPVLLMSLCLSEPTACQTIKSKYMCAQRHLAVSLLSASIHDRTERPVRDSRD